MASSLQCKDELLLTLSLKWSESDRPQRNKNDLQQCLQTWFNKQKSRVFCSVERTSADKRAVIKLKPLPALGDLQKLTGETMTTEGGKAVTITSVSLDSQTLDHVSGNPVLMSDDISPRKQSRPFSAASASNAPLDDSEGVSEESCLVSVDHFCYMNHIYKKEIRQIEKKNKSNMVVHVNVMFEADQTDGRPNEALSDFSKLILNHSAESRGSVVPLKFVDPDQWSEAMKVIHKDHKLFLTLSSEEVMVRGPSQSRETFSRTLNAAERTNMPSKESGPASQTTSQRADMSTREPLFSAELLKERNCKTAAKTKARTDLDNKESRAKKSKVDAYKTPAMLHQTSLTSTQLYGATGFSSSLKNLTSHVQVKDTNIRASSSIQKTTKYFDAPQAGNTLSIKERMVHGPSQSQDTFSGILNAAQRTNVNPKDSQPASQTTSKRADMSTSDFHLTLMNQTSSPSTSTQLYGATGFSDSQHKDLSIRSLSKQTTNNADASKAKNNKDERCPICLDAFIRKKQLKCKHEFCKKCLKKTKKKIGPICPVCKDVFGVMEGNQPDGTMTWFKYPTPLRGFSDCGHLLVSYDFPGGIQTEKHPNPGQPYHGTVRLAYLPDNKEGNEVLELLKKAFDQKLIFTIGTSRTSGKDNMVIWNDIPHKTVISGGAESFGYPDPGYLSRVKEDLKAKGIQ